MDRRIAKSRQAMKQALLELMEEKHFDQITVQDIADKADISRKTFYLHYVDKYDLLDRVIEESLEELRAFSESVCEMDWLPATEMCFQYLQNHYAFFSTMLTSKGAPYFRARFLAFEFEAFQEELRRTTGDRPGALQDVMIPFVVHAYVGIVEWWLANGMPYPPKVMAEHVGTLLQALYETPMHRDKIG
ncbi:TetR family transcriptional regulator [Alicyclobacillus hesperidum]|uniref:DNA-binding transcriptional regulator, AcrR family n=2 Tax=Alicyclobacillus hesperidum TaxID=89784 RepID=A0A1H2VNF6_9BACL|nr:TetR family transcriptional regulator [Alicyclobacillus hesperidum]SDW69836.1 DNA-binding transcriptional regulator, AcrR family [Alicyclobacillus hesperidum]